MAQKRPLSPPFLRVTLNQLSVVLVGLLPVYLLTGGPATFSLLSGSACALVPQAFFALRMHRASGSSAAHAARLGMAAEGGKFLLSAAAFAVVFAVVKPERPGLVFVGFALMWVIQVADGIRLIREQSENEA
ncbi:MAG: ATP synthase protein I [Halieaceae bacterium]